MVHAMYRSGGDSLLGSYSMSGNIARMTDDPRGYQTAVENLRRLVLDDDLGGVVGLYLYGSAVDGGLRPQSDLDLLLLTQRSLRQEEREALLDFFVTWSGSRAISGPGRPIELTSLVHGDVVPWVY